MNDELVDAYLNDLKAGRRVAANTVSAYARDLMLLARFAEARETTFERLDRRDLEAFVRGLMASGLAPRSVARSVACVRGFYRFLQLDRQLPSNPADDLRAPRSWPSLPKCLSVDEVDALLEQPDTATSIGIRDRALIELLYATGLRVSELVSLQSGDLHLDAGHLTCVGKGGKERLVPIGSAAVDWVRRYLASARTALLGKRTSRWIFVNARGGIRLPQVEAPTATLDGRANAAAAAGGREGGARNFCFLFGHTAPFDRETLAALYPTHEQFVSRFNAAVDRLEEAGYLLPPEAEAARRAARESPIGR